MFYVISAFLRVSTEKFVINSSDIEKLRFFRGYVGFNVPNKDKKNREKIRPLGTLLSYFKNLWIQGKKGTFSTNLKMAYQTYIGGGLVRGWWARAGRLRLRLWACLARKHRFNMFSPTNPCQFSFFQSNSSKFLDGIESKIENFDGFGRKLEIIMLFLA